MIKKILPTASLAIVLFGLSLISTPGQAKEFYKWIDDEGVTHYSVRPPADAEVETEALTIKTPGQTASEDDSETDMTAGAEDDEKRSNKAALSSEELAKIRREEKENCDKARKNLYTLENRARIFSSDEKTGENHYLTDEEREQWKTESKEAVEAFCK